MRVIVVALTLISGAQNIVRADELHARIDQLIDAAAGNDVEPQSNDSEFLRRAFLDLAGRTPSPVEVGEFMNSDGEGKRAALIDRLLASADYPRRMQELFHVILMERRGDNEEWTQFLRTAFEQNLPWHHVAAAIINPNDQNEDLRGAAFFHTQRLVKEGAMAPVDVPALTRDVGRMFAGIDLQCAQCHDHLTVSDYSQQDFQGLHMVFENIDIRRDVKFPAIGEKLMTTPKEYASVFEQVPMQTAPRVPGGQEVRIVVFDADQEYAIAPDKKTKTFGVPKFSPLKELANGLASSENDLFCRNIVNRLWFVMMGRGLIEPLDLHHSSNPASHPELLSLLASKFADQEFNIRWLLRELALTQTYQRTGRQASAAEPAAISSYRTALEKRLSAEQLFWSIGTATGEFDAVRTAMDSTVSQPEESPDEDNPEPKDGEQRELSAEQLVLQSDSLQALRKQLVATFSNPPRDPETDFRPTVAGALYFMHSEQIHSLLKPRPGNLTHQLSEMQSADEVMNRLYISIFSRVPTDAEKEELLPYLNVDKDKRMQKVANLAWAMLTSTEFIVNH